MHKDGGYDLRVFIADQFGDRCRIHPLQAFYATSVAIVQDAIEQAGRLVVAQRFGQHAADIIACVHADGCFL